jgi:hypothetical protein
LRPSAGSRFSFPKIRLHSRFPRYVGEREPPDGRPQAGQDNPAAIFQDKEEKASPDPGLFSFRSRHILSVPGGITAGPAGNALRKTDTDQEKERNKGSGDG